MYADINGTRIYYEDTGKGAPILFSHGLLFNTTMYAAQVEYLRDRFRCISFDHRGQGNSGDDNSLDTISVEILAEDAVALINHLGLGAVHWVGHSLGGFVGIRLASKYPSLVRSLTLLNTSADEEPAKNLLKYRVMNFTARFVGAPAVADLLMPLAFGASTMSDKQLVEKRKVWRQIVAGNRRSIWRAANGVINRISQHDVLAKITAPTLVVTSVEDKARVMHESERIAAGIPGAKLVCLQRGGHMLPLEQPDEVNKALAEFLG